jgi:hypothetical protein
MKLKPRPDSQMPFIENPQEEIKKRLGELTRENSVNAGMDDQELKERQQAAQCYAGEDPAHFISYGQDCVTTSVDSMRKIRKTQKDCWSAYNEDAPPQFSNKEDWQSKIVIPKPYGAVQFAMAVVRKAFSSDFLSIENEINSEVATFWEKLLQHEFNQNHADFTIAFTDSTGMAFAVGQSLEMIPTWKPGQGLKFILVEPWKIHRDPDAISRHPQSGLYWIHQEYLDFHILKQGEKTGRYINVDAVKDYLGGSSDGLTSEEIAARKDMYWQRSTYRKAVLTSEFWGTVLDRKGELLLPSCTYTWAGNHIIGLPKRTPYRTLRWPGVSFSPLPHFLRYDGRGLLQGVKTLWHWMCSLMSLHSDSLNWVVNPPKEIDVSSLVDQDDLDDYPGKVTPTRGTVSGQQAIRTIDRKNITNEVLANINYADQVFQRGTFVTDLVQGLPGWRAEVTARESAQSLEQAMNVFSLMGMNLENGAIHVTEAAAQVIEASIGYDDLLEMFPEETIAQLINLEAPTGISLPEVTGAFHISGISAIMQDAEILKAIKELVLPLCDSSGPFMSYVNPYNLLKSIERRTNLEDEKIFIDEVAAKGIQAEQKRMLEQAEMDRAAQEGSAVAQSEAEAMQAQQIAERGPEEAEPPNSAGEH